MVTEGRVRPALIGLGGLLVGTLAFFNFVAPQTPVRRNRAPAALSDEFIFWSWVKELPIPVPETATSLAVMLALFGGMAFLIYAISVAVTWKRPVSRSNLTVGLGIAVILFGSSLFAMPNYNSDIYNYMVQGRLTAVYGLNPHYVAADEFPDDPIHPYAGRQYTRIPGDYLPAWSILNAGLAAMAGDNPVTALMFYRTALVVLNTLNLLLIYAILRKLSPGHQLTGIIVYGWNPVVVLEGQGHVDTVMAFYLLLGILFLVFNRRVAAVASLTLSVFTKWITLPLLGIYLLRFLWDRRWDRFALSVATCIATIGLIYVPVVEDASIFQLHFNLLMKGGSTIPEGVQTAVTIGFAAMIVALSRIKRGTLNELLWIWAVTMLVFIALLSKIGFAWYLIVPMSVVSLVPDWRVVLAAMTLGLASLAFQLRDSMFNREFPLPQIFDLDRFWVFLILSLVIPGVALVWVRVRAWRASQPEGRTK